MSVEAAAQDRRVWTLQLLGRVQADCGNWRIQHFGTQRVVALLGLLALKRHQPQPRLALARLVWPGVPTAPALNRLRNALSTLQRALGPPGTPRLLLSTPAGLALATNALQCDLWDFEDCIGRGDLSGASALYRGELMPDLEDAWVRVERKRLARLLHELSGRIALAAAAVHPGAVPPPTNRFFGRHGELQQITDALPHAALLTITGLGGSGKTRLAIEVLRHACAGPATKWRGIVVPLADCRSVDQLQTQLRASLGLPAQPGSVLEQVQRALLGPGTLLLLDNFEQLLRSDTQGPVLEFVQALMKGLPALRLLVTSRMTLGLEGESQVVLHPLSAADAQALLRDRLQAQPSTTPPSPSDAQELATLCELLEGLPLAIELAAAAVRGQGRHAQTGLSEFVSRWPNKALKQTGPEVSTRHRTLHSALEWSWNLLEDDARRLLGALSVFRGGAGAADVRAVADLAESGTLLDGLQAHSLLTMEHDPDGTPRYRMLELVREFAAGKLVPARCQQLRQRHRQQFMDRVAGHDTQAAGIGSQHLGNINAALLSALEDDVPHEALQLALALRHQWENCGIDPETLDLLGQAADSSQAPADLRVQACTLLVRLTLARADTPAARSWSERALRVAGAQHRLRSLALSACGRVALFGDWRTEDLPALTAQAWELAGTDPEAQALALMCMAALAQRRDGDAATALKRYEQAAAHFGAAGQPHEARRLEYARASALCDLRQFKDALSMAQRQEAACSARGEWARCVLAINLQGVVHSQLRQWEEAVAAYARCARLSHAHGLQQTLSIAMWNHGRSLARLRLPEQAAQLMGFAAAWSARHFGELSPADRRQAAIVRRLVGVQIGAAAADQSWRAGEALTLAQALALSRDLGARG